MTDNDLDQLASAPNTAPVFNAVDYLDDLAHLDISEAEKIEFLQTLWSIMATFVNLGFGVDSVIPAFQKAWENGAPTLEHDISKDDFNIAAHEIAPGIAGPK